MKIYTCTELIKIGIAERCEAFKRPQDVYKYVEGIKGVFDDDREAFVGIYLDSRHRPICDPYVVSVGSLNASLVHPREVFGPALELRAAAVIVAHNHPSGNPKPSSDDLELTARLAKGGELLGVALLDHIVVGDGESTSIREYGWPEMEE
jgi:DNA repair protein RadC